MKAYADLREQAWLANLELPKLGLALYTFGNASAIDRKKGVFAIKPSGVAYADLKPADMVIVDLDDRVVDGRLKPSSDTRSHTVLYSHFPSIGGVTHTHSTYATAWAQAAREIPVFGTTHADHLSRPVPCTDFMEDSAVKGDYEKETGLQIVARFRTISPDEVEMVLVAGHGPFTWGRTAAKAVYNGRILEELAKMAYLTLAVGPSTFPLKESLIRKHFERKHGKNAYYGQD